MNRIRLGIKGRLVLVVMIGVAMSPLSADNSLAADNKTAVAERSWMTELRDNPGSIIERLKKDAQPKAYLFQFPGVSKVLKPWYDTKANLLENYGFQFGLSYTALYQKTNDKYLSEDDAAGFDLDIAGVWTFRGRGTQSPTLLGFDFFWRDKMGTDIPPLELFIQYGSLSTVSFSI